MTIKKFEVRANKIFIPDLFKWVIITIKKYDERRKVSGYFGMADLTAVDKDARKVRRGIKGLGALDEEIIEITDDDCDYKRL